MDDMLQSECEGSPRFEALATSRRSSVISFHNPTNTAHARVMRDVDPEESELSHRVTWLACEGSLAGFECNKHEQKDTQDILAFRSSLQDNCAQRITLERGLVVGDNANYTGIS